MSTRHGVAVVLLAVLSLACAGGGAAEPSRAARIEAPPGGLAPWLGMEMPVDGGEVQAGPDTLLVSYHDPSARERLENYVDVLTSAGWKPLQDLSTGEQLVHVYERGGDQLVFSVAEDDGLLTVTVQRLALIDTPTKKL